MITGEQLILTKYGIEVSNKTLESIGVYPKSQVHVLPIKSFDYREHEPSSKFPYDLLITPIPPRRWPFIMRFSISIRNTPEALESALVFFYKYDINILFSECNRAGHHHKVLNVIGIVKRLQGKTLSQLYYDLQCWRDEQINVNSNNSDKEIRYNEPKWYKTLEVIEYLSKHSELIKELWGLVEKTEENSSIRMQEDVTNILHCIRDFLFKCYKNKHSIEVTELQEDQVKEILSEIKIEDLIGIISNKFKSKNIKDKLKKLKLLKKSDIDEFICKLFFREKGMSIYLDREVYSEYLFKSDYPAFYIAVRYDKDKPIHLILENEIKECRKRVNNYISSGGSRYDIYNKVRWQMMTLRRLLDMLTAYKYMLSEKYKILLLEDSLSLTKNKLTDLNRQSLYNSFYLYNIKYYKYQTSLDLFSSTSLYKKYIQKLNTNYSNSLEKNCHDFIQSIANEQIARVSAIREDLHNEDESLRKSPDEIKSEIYKKYEFCIKSVKIHNAINKLNEMFPHENVTEPARLDLDPITITPTEFLSDAFYHRAFYKEFLSIVENERIPFPVSDNPADEFLRSILDSNFSSTMAITSKVSECLSIRLSPIPISDSGNFIKISLKNYQRKCQDDCFYEGVNEVSQKMMFDVNESALIRSCHNQNIGESDEKMKDFLNENSLLKCNNKCTGTTMGLVLSLVKALNDNKKDNKFNILRLYNDTSRISESSEHGNINIIAHKGREEGNLKLILKRISENYTQNFKHIQSSKHIYPGQLSINPLSGGNIFVSITFAHPMFETWLNTIKEIGEEYGFAEVNTVVTYTKPVTFSVAEKIQKCNGMIQILALPLNERDSEERTNIKDNPMTWIHSEYLTAVNNGKKIVRLVDSKSISESEIPIGKDHAIFSFSIDEPYQRFEDMVRKAMQELRKDLAQDLGLG